MTTSFFALDFTLLSRYRVSGFDSRPGHQNPKSHSSVFLTPGYALQTLRRLGRVLAA